MWRERRLIGMALVILSEAKDLMVAPDPRFAQGSQAPLDIMATCSCIRSSTRSRSTCRRSVSRSPSTGTASRTWSAFGLFLWLAARRARLPQFATLGWTRRDVEDLLFYGVLGTVIGGRLGYVCSTSPATTRAHPLEILAVWKGGMSFHGGLLGVIAAMMLFARSAQRPFLEVTDLVAPCVPTGFAAGRIGNFINGELWGRFADPALPWAMVFPQSGSPLPRHPSQLYQFALEGPAAVAVPVVVRQASRAASARSPGHFLVGYGVLRFVAEFFREPDSFLGLLALGMSMGQWLCVPMIAVGIALWLWGRGRVACGRVPEPCD